MIRWNLKHEREVILLQGDRKGRSLDKSGTYTMIRWNLKHEREVIILVLLFILFRIVVFFLGVLIVFFTIISALRTFVLPRSAPDPISRAVFLTMRRIFDLRSKRARS